MADRIFNIATQAFSVYFGYKNHSLYLPYCDTSVLFLFILNSTQNSSVPMQPIQAIQITDICLNLCKISNCAILATDYS